MWHLRHREGEELSAVRAKRTLKQRLRTSCTRSNVRTVSKESMEGDKPPCRLKMTFSTKAVSGK